MPKHVEVPVPEGEPKLWRCPKHGLLEPFRHSRGWGTGEPGEYGTCPVMEDEDTGCGQVMQPVQVPVPEEAEDQALSAARDCRRGELVPPIRQQIQEALQAAAPFIAAKAEHERDQAVQQERERLDEAVSALPDPEKLRLLADWFDREQADGRWGEGRDVQDDLRKWADACSAVVAALDQEGDGDE